jgi:hypothetical protein
VFWIANPFSGLLEPKNVVAFGAEWIVYRYKIGFGKESEPIFKVRALTEEGALSQARVHYKVKDNEFIWVSDKEVTAGDLKRVGEVPEEGS